MIESPEPWHVSIIVPVYNGGEAFVRCLDALAALAPPPGEIVVVDDGSSDGSSARAQRASFRVLHTGSVRSGPASARNLGARQAQGEILFFLDADVEVRHDAVAQIIEPFHGAPCLAAAYGSYDDAPVASNFVSQYKNLFHHFVHQDASGAGTSFWAGCGAIRRDIFLRLGGFNTAYKRPSIEDIELGYRLKKMGYQTQLLKCLQVTHLKQWTLGSLLENDVRDRALPWAQLILREREFPADLNLKVSHRLSVVLVFVMLGALASTIVAPAGLMAAGACALLLLVLNLRLYRFFASRRGLWFVLRAIPLHWFYYLYSGSAFALGVVMWLQSQPQTHGAGHG